MRRDTNKIQSGPQLPSLRGPVPMLQAFYITGNDKTDIARNLKFLEYYGSIEMLWTEYYVECLFSKGLQQYRKTIIRGGMPQDHTFNALLELYRYPTSKACQNHLNLIRRLSKYFEAFVTYRIVDFPEFVLTLLNFRCIFVQN